MIDSLHAWSPTLILYIVDIVSLIMRDCNKLHSENAPN